MYWATEYCVVELRLLDPALTQLGEHPLVVEDRAAATRAGAHGERTVAHGADAADDAAVELLAEGLGGLPRPGTGLRACGHRDGTGGQEGERHRAGGDLDTFLHCSDSLFSFVFVC
jgi:hypothetical protein